MNFLTFLIKGPAVGALSLCAIFAQTPKPTKTKNFSAQKALSAEEQLKTFKLAEGFEIELVASEKHGVVNPIDLTFDNQGRLWTQTARMYPLDPVARVNFSTALKMMKDPNLEKDYPNVSKIKKLYTLEERGTDQVLILDNPELPATEPLNVWAEGLSIPQSIMPYKNGCYIAHGSEFLYFEDTDGDGKSDKEESVISGFGFFDTHTMVHSIVRAPGGWLNFSQGALNYGVVTVNKSGKELKVSYAKNLRYSLDGEDLEIIGIARDNVWGYQIKKDGQWYATSANDSGRSVLPFEDQTMVSGIGGDKIRPYQQPVSYAHDFRVGGSGISGLAFSEDGEYGFPEEWANDVAFLANPITRTINAVRIDRETGGTVNAELLSDLLTCSDEWFRPVNIEFGPDGSLYIADWYNKIVSHNEVIRDHPDRDRKHGRIWRIRHESQKPLEVPNVAKADNNALLTHLLKGNTLWERRAAWQEIVDRGATELTPMIAKVITGGAQFTPDIQILALWVLEGLGGFQEDVLTKAMASDDGNVRREAIRSLASYEPSAEIAAKLLKPYINDSNAMVRSQVIRTLEEVGVANDDTIALLVEACRDASAQNLFGNGYEQNFERFLARKALESYQGELESFLASGRAKEFSSAKLLWAGLALPKEASIKLFLNNWESVSQGELDPNIFASMTHLLGSSEIDAVTKSVFRERAEEVISLTLGNMDTVNLNNFNKAIAPYVNGLLGSDDEANIKKGISFINQLYSGNHTKQVQGLLTSQSTLRAPLIKALGNDPKVAPKVYSGLFALPDLSFSDQLSCIASLAVKDTAAATKIANSWFPGLSESDRNQAIERLSHTRGGARILLGLILKKALPIEALGFDATNRITKLAGKKNKEFAKLAKVVAKAEEDAQAARHTKIQSYVKAVDTLKGNPQLGQAYFGACQACHMVGNTGIAVGPPLDGGAHRTVEHLITAIVSPDDAVEGAYALYAVVLKDGRVIEAMLKSKTQTGITMIGAGGAETFVPAHLIASSGNVGIRSFMPKSFGVMPDQWMADLVSYFKTIK